jgi:hypothetical protein
VIDGTLWRENRIIHTAMISPAEPEGFDRKELSVPAMDNALEGPTPDRIGH